MQFNLDDSDFTWLVYADWLEEHNQYDLANLIRAEVEDDNPAWSFDQRLYMAIGGGENGQINAFPLSDVGRPNSVGGFAAFGTNIGGFYTKVGGE